MTQSDYFSLLKYDSHYEKYIHVNVLNTYASSKVNKWNFVFAITDEMGQFRQKIW